MKKILSKHLFYILLALLVPLSSAHACLFDIPVPGLKEGPTPFPPCTAKSTPGHDQLRSKMVRLGGKMVTLAMEIQNTKAEVRAWQNTIEEAKQVEEELKKVEGDLTVNPMEALVTNYEQSPMMVWVKEGQGMKERIVNSSLGDLTDYVQKDLRAHADSMLAAWRNPDSLSTIFWGSNLAEAEARRSDKAFGLGAALENQVVALEKFRNDNKVVNDSLMAIGNRMASRYENQSEASGEAEAKISSLAANLAKLRGTAYGARAQSIQQKLRALESINQTKNMLEASRATRQTTSVKY